MTKKLLTLDTLVKEVQAGNLVVEQCDTRVHHIYNSAKKELFEGEYYYSLHADADEDGQRAMYPIDLRSKANKNLFVCQRSKQDPSKLETICTLEDVISTRTVIWPKDADGPIERQETQLQVQLKVYANAKYRLVPAVAVEKSEAIKIMEAVTYLQSLGFDISARMETVVK